MSPYAPFPFEQFGGLDLSGAVDETGGAVDLLNVEFDRQGSLRSRDGYTKLTATSGATRYDSVFSITGTPLTSAASTQLPANATTVAATGTGGGATVPWANPAHVEASDDSYATSALVSSESSDYLEATDFSLAVPSGATVLGITVEVERHSSSGSGIKDNRVSLLKAGAIQTANYAQSAAWPASDATQSYGGASDLWGTTWTVDDINDPNFGVAFQAHNTDPVLTVASFDMVRVTVYYTPVGTSYVLAGASHSRLDEVNSDGTVTSSVATPDDTQHSYAAFGSPATSAVYIGNSATSVRKFSAGTFSVPTGMPTAKYLALQSPDNRLVAANVAAIPTGAGSTASTSLVHFSDAGAPETWSANNYVYLTPGDNEDIQGVVAWKTLLFVFKQTKYFVFYGNSQDSTGNPVFNYRPITTGIGLAAPLAIAPAPNGVYFLDRRGIYLTTGGEPQLVSGGLDPLFLGSPSTFYQGGTINPSALNKAALCWFSGRLYFSFPQGSSTTNDRTLVYDPGSQQWTLWDMPMGAMAAVGAQPARLAFTYGNDIGLYAQNAFPDDAGTPISSRYRSGFIGMNYIHRSAHGTWLTITSQEGTVREVIFDGTGSFNFSMSRDFNLSLPTVGGGAQATVTLGTAPDVRQGRYRVAQRGRRLGFQINSTSPWAVYSMTWSIRGARVPGLKTAS